MRISPDERGVMRWNVSRECEETRGETGGRLVFSCSCLRLESSGFDSIRFAVSHECTRVQLRCWDWRECACSVRSWYECRSLKEQCSTRKVGIMWCRIAAASCTRSHNESREQCCVCVVVWSRVGEKLRDVLRRPERSAVSLACRNAVSLLLVRVHVPRQSESAREWERETCAHAHTARADCQCGMAWQWHWEWDLEWKCDCWAGRGLRHVSSPLLFSPLAHTQRTHCRAERREAERRGARGRKRVLSSRECEWGAAGREGEADGTFDRRRVLPVDVEHSASLADRTLTAHCTPLHSTAQHCIELGSYSPARAASGRTHKSRVAAEQRATLTARLLGLEAMQCDAMRRGGRGGGSEDCTWEQEAVAPRLHWFGALASNRVHLCVNVLTQRAASGRVSKYSNASQAAVARSRHLRLITSLLRHICAISLVLPWEFSLSVCARLCGDGAWSGRASRLEQNAGGGRRHAACERRASLLHSASFYDIIVWVRITVIVRNLRSTTSAASLLMYRTVNVN